MFPVYTYQNGIELPQEGTYFLVAGNGLWLHKDTGIMKAFIPVETISVLEDLDADAFIQCSLPKLPAMHVWKIKTFFKKVVEKHNSEACIILYFNKETKKYKIHVPTQKVSHTSVRYKREALANIEGMEGFLCVGTIHSHCDFMAFHSGTDVSDEEDFDGLHCTFGHNNKDDFSISASIVVNGHRLKVDPLEYLDGITFVSECEEDSMYSLIDPDPQWAEGLDEWMGKVTGSLFSGALFNKPTKFIRGEKIDWEGHCATLKEQHGEGPFVVESYESGSVVIKTKDGLLTRFSDKLFRNHDEDKKN